MQIYVASNIRLITVICLTGLYNSARLCAVVCVYFFNGRYSFTDEFLPNEREIVTLFNGDEFVCVHYSDVIMTAMSSQITSLTSVYSIVYSGADQTKHQNSASLAFVGGIHRWPVNSSHKGPVTRKMLPFDDVIMLKNIT